MNASGGCTCSRCMQGGYCNIGGCNHVYVGSGLYFHVRRMHDKEGSASRHGSSGEAREGPAGGAAIASTSSEGAGGLHAGHEPLAKKVCTASSKAEEPDHIAQARSTLRDVRAAGLRASASTSYADAVGVAVDSLALLLPRASRSLA